MDQITPELVLEQRIDWLERVSESRTKTKHSSLKATWNKGRTIKVIPGSKADKPQLDSDEELKFEAGINSSIARSGTGAGAITMNLTRLFRG